MITTQPYRLRDNDKVTDDESTYVLRVRDMPDADKPRERLIELGPGELTVAELLAIMWGVGNKNEDVLAMARRTLKDYGEKTIGNERNSKRLAEAAGISVQKACQVIAAFEIGRRYASAQTTRPIFIRDPKEAFKYFRSMSLSPKEQLRALYLNSRHQVIHDEVISIGSLTASIVHPREVFQPALERGAVAIILAHNHPSNNIEPTMADIQITEQLISAGEVLGIDILDHLVIANDRYISITDEFTKLT